MEQNEVERPQAPVEGPDPGAADTDPSGRPASGTGLMRLAAVEGRQAALWFSATVAGLAVGLLFRRADALVDLPRILPLAVLAAGGMALAGFVAFRVATGTFQARTTGVTVLLALGGAAVAAAVVPGAPPPVDSSGTLITTRLDGRSYQVDATCRWDPPMRHVLTLTAALPDEIGTLSGTTLVIDFGAGSVTASAGETVVTLAAGDGVLDPPLARRSPDDGSGRLVLDGSRGGTITGTLEWTCFSGGSDVGRASPPRTALRGW